VRIVIEVKCKTNTRVSQDDKVDSERNKAVIRARQKRKGRKREIGTIGNWDGGGGLRRDNCAESSEEDARTSCAGAVKVSREGKRNVKQLI
jgi:hypothetical protein